MAAFEMYTDYLQKRYEKLPRGFYISLILVRKTESETIFRTEGSGEDLVKETVSAGIEHTRRIQRVMMSKRKQVAVERRTGREFLRRSDLLLKAKNGKDCLLNTNAPCEQCIDCRLYGFAVGSGGAHRSRVISDDAYSIDSVPQIADKRTFNAIYENGTMRHPDGGAASRSIQRDEYIRPQTHFLDIETLKDVTLTELHYVLGNIMRSTRYGAISSRLGRVSNSVIALAFSDCELFSTLELTQAVYDHLAREQELSASEEDEDELSFPLLDEKVKSAVLASIDRLQGKLFSRTPVWLTGDALQTELQGVQELYANEERIVAALREQSAAYQL
jgi:CRISPR-associated protein Csc2